MVPWENIVLSCAAVFLPSPSLSVGLLSPQPLALFSLALRKSTSFRRCTVSTFSFILLSCVTVFLSYLLLLQLVSVQLYLFPLPFILAKGSAVQVLEPLLLSQPSINNSTVV